MICYFFAGFSGTGAGAGAGAGGGDTAGCAAGGGGEYSFFFSQPKRATAATMIRTRIKTEYFFTKLYLLNEF
jgi:hypothetical protein